MEASIKKYRREIQFNFSCYIYFIDELLGLGYIRISTWCPFRLQIYSYFT
jgi:hypothetical protein